MGSIPLHYVDLRAFAYATEDEDRVRRAVQTFLPAETELEREVSEGHHGDLIVVLSTRLENADAVRVVLDRIRSAESFGSVLGELEERVTDNCEFYLQFDKQAAYEGEVVLGRGVTFRAKVEAYPASRGAALENLRDFFGS